MKRWEVESFSPEIINKIQNNLGISQLLAILLANRGISDLEEAEKFLSVSLYDLYDPYLLKDMGKVASRIKDSLRKKEKVYLHGDYDVDGISSLAMLYKLYQFHNIDVLYYIPHRIKEGYGISPTAVQEAIQEKVDLFIAVDCGISSYDLIKEITSCGIDVIIIDHHKPKKGLSLPPCYGLINPWQEGCNYPNKDLTSSGLVFKLLQALFPLDSDYISEMLDLACLGMIADVSPVVGENRIIIKFGLEKLKDTSHTGLKALINIAGLSRDQISSRAVSHIIAPRLNAMGRLGSAHDSLRILMTNSYQEAERLASILDERNRERQQIEKEILNEVMNCLEANFNFKQEKVIVLAGKDWHRGVVGIVASRVVDKYNRPAIILSEEDDFLLGSGRSIKNFHIFEAISHCDEFLDEYGGHAYACGLILKKEKFLSFKEKINSYASNFLQPEDLIPRVKIDSFLELSQINESLLKDISLLSPFGPANPEPLFLIENLTVLTSPQEIPRKGVKFWVKKGNFSSEAIGFGLDLPIQYIKPGSKINLVYIPRMNEWEGIKTLSLYIKDLKII